MRHQGGASQDPQLRGHRALRKRYKAHVNELWELVPLQDVGKVAAGLVALLRTQAKPFDDWSVDRRYESGEAISAVVVNRHREAARRVLGAAQLLGERRGA